MNGQWILGWHFEIRLKKKQEKTYRAVINVLFKTPISFQQQIDN